MDVGVNIFGGSLLVLLSVAIARTRTYPVWIAALGVLSGAVELVRRPAVSGAAPHAGATA